jgi:esterase
VGELRDDSEHCHLVAELVKSSPSKTEAETRQVELAPGRRFRSTSPMPVLAHRDLGGEGRAPLIILHGMLGSSRNWQSAGAGLAADFHVHALDLRDHGDSFHAPATDYAQMMDDVIAWLDHQGIEKAHLLGHSMGGKIGMLLACRHADRLDRIVVVDIAPRAYKGTHEKLFHALNGVDLKALKSRGEAEALLADEIPDLAMRRFLLTNLRRNESTDFWEWAVNLAGLTASMPALEAEFLAADDRYDDEMLFVLGGKSHYFEPGDEKLVKRHFPAARFETIAESGHNPHFEAREHFVEIVKQFFDRQHVGS